MPSYSASGNFPATAGANSYRLEITARTSEVTGGTLVEVFAQVVKFQTHGTVTTSGTGGRSWSLPGGREGSTSGPSLSSGSSDWPYSFARTAPLTVNVYNFFNRYIPYSYGSSTTLSVSVNGVNSGFLTSRTVSVNVPLFTQPVPVAPSPPTSVSASTGRTDGILISWSGASGNISSYGIWYGPPPTASSNPDFFVFTTSGSGSYLDTSVPAGSSRTYWVRAFGEGGNSAYVPANGVTGTRLSPLPVFSDTTLTGNWVVGKDYSTAPDRTVAASDTNQYTILTSNPSINSFPHWISINNSGQLSGTPTTSGTFTFRAQASGNGGTTASSNITIVVHGALSWIDQTLANGIKGVPYSDRVEAQNATAYAISPAFNLSTTGLSFNPLSGLIAGTPKEIASYTFTITASNPGDSLSKQFTISFKSGGRRIQDGVAVTIENKKRWDTSLNPAQWVDITTARRFNSGTNQWEEISN
jgi:hypothetical protein